MVRYLVSLLLVSALFADVRTMPVASTPESRTIILRIAIPKTGQVVSNPVWVQFRIEGYSLGASSQFERSNEIDVSKKGQTVHVVIDNEPYFAINGPAVEPFDLSSNFYDTSYKFRVPYNLEEGKHVIRMFPTRSYGESLKGDNTFVAIPFYVGSQQENFDVNLKAPYITYNEPSPYTSYSSDRPILLDFFVSNVALSSDGYKVRLSIDGQVNRMLTSWMPYYIYGLSSGSHTIRLELLNSKNNLVPGPFNDVEQTIVID